FVYQPRTHMPKLRRVPGTPFGHPSDHSRALAPPNSEATSLISRDVVSQTGTNRAPKRPFRVISVLIRGMAARDPGDGRAGRKIAERSSGQWRLRVRPARLTRGQVGGGGLAGVGGAAEEAGEQFEFGVGVPSADLVQRGVHSGVEPVKVGAALTQWPDGDRAAVGRAGITV